MSDKTKPLHGVRVMVVDDNADQCEILTILLQDNGAVVVTGQSVAEALAVFARERPDVVLADIALPDDDGFGLLRRLRAQSRAGGPIAAIALTGYPRDSYGPADWNEFQAHLMKPVDIADLLATIARVLRPGPSDPGAGIDS